MMHTNDNSAIESMTNETVVAMAMMAFSLILSQLSEVLGLLMSGGYGI